VTGPGRPIRLRIDRLVLDGVALGPGDAMRFQEALVAELGQMIAAHVGAPTGGAFDRAAPAQAISTGPDAAQPGGPARFGRAVARSAARSILQTIGSTS
jgi:hypothetical protein